MKVIKAFTSAPKDKEVEKINSVLSYESRLFKNYEKAMNSSITKGIVQNEINEHCEQVKSEAIVNFNHV